jgi:hypothetical protein
MGATYRVYMLNKEIVEYAHLMTIIKAEVMDLGAIVTFTTDCIEKFDDFFEE